MNSLSTDAIVITAANDIPTIQRMLHQGAVDYIMKPFKFERVQEALGKLPNDEEKIRQGIDVIAG